MVQKIALADIPLTLGGAIGFQVENAMASIAAVWALGVDWDIIRHGLAGFSNDADNASGAGHACHAPHGGHQWRGRPA